MITFIYSASRHSDNTNRRLSQSTIRNDFNLDLLRSSIKGRYEMKGHGLSNFQKILKSYELIEEFYGHVININDSKNAIWLKLNYDRIGKTGTKFVGGWQDIDEEALSEKLPEYERLSTMVSNLSNNVSNLAFYSNNNIRFLNRIKDIVVNGSYTGYKEMMLYKINTGVDDLNKFDETLNSFKEILNEITLKKIEIQNHVRDYMKSKKIC